MAAGSSSTRRTRASSRSEQRRLVTLPRRRPASRSAPGVQIGDGLAVDAHTLGGHVLLDPLVGQPGCDQSVAHGHRGGLIVGHAFIVQPGTDSSGWACLRVSDGGLVVLNAEEKDAPS
jgi:hypothetical protein